MRIIQLCVLFLFLSLSSVAFARANLDDYDFVQERMLCAEDGIYIISSFEDSDNIAAYTYYGEKLWDRNFFAKITSWKVIGNYIITFSKDRIGYSTYLTCLNRTTGEKVWQRP